MNFHKSICTEQGYSIMLTIILSLRIWFGKKFIKVQEKNPCLFINSMKLNYLKKKKKIKEKKKV